jgi:hypothetical protein
MSDWYRNGRRLKPAFGGIRGAVPGMIQASKGHRSRQCDSNAAEQMRNRLGERLHDGEMLL